MHGAMTVFEVVTVRLRDADGAEEVGYTFTCGTNGAAIHDAGSRSRAADSGRRRGLHRGAVEEVLVGVALWRSRWWLRDRFRKARPWHRVRLDGDENIDYRVKN